MNELRKLNRDLKLEVKIVAKDDKLMGNQITIDYLDKDFQLVKNKEDLELAQVYFNFNIEIEEDSNLTVGSLVNLIDDIPDDKIEFMFDDGNDNWSVTKHEVEIYQNKAILSIFVDIEKINTLPVFSAAVDFLNYESTDEVTDFIYEDFKDEIYRYLNCKAKGDFYFIISAENNDNDIKSWENAMDNTSCFIESKVLQMPYKKQIDFIIENYDADFEVV